MAASRAKLAFIPLFVVLLIFTGKSSGQDDSSKDTTTETKPSQDEASGAGKGLSDDFRAKQALEVVRNWAERFGRDIHYGTQEATCLRSIRDQFDPAKSSRTGPNRASIKSIDWTRTHAEIVKTISTTMSWHRDAVEAIARESEYLAGNHTYDKNLTQSDYIDVHRLKNIDEESVEAPFDQDQEENYSSLNESNDLQPGELRTSNGLPAPNESSSADGEPLQQPLEPLPEPSALIKAFAEPNSNGTGPQNQPQVAISPGEWQSEIRRLKLSRHKNFPDVLINTQESAVHVPVHIYSGDPQVMNGIVWSEGLTRVFRNNFVANPKLTNQYFASQFGFMRLFPAQKWQIERTDPDLYDARMRPWYVAGASSRKDVVILVDSSGSMTGSRRDIAKGVVFEILDTLTDNDHFLILKFSDTIQQVGVPSCAGMRVEENGPGIASKNTVPLEKLRASETSHKEKPSANETDINSLYLLPATGRNVRHIKTNFTIPTSGIANFSQALVIALQVLNNYQRSEHLGSQCNKAIMLITDGSPSDFEEIFNKYNIPNAPIRVFTYLIGREAGDVTHTKMMACHNRGYYTHVINLAEVRETVQQYIPVMARPLVLNGTHPVTWTPAYGELTYQVLTDWIWESKRRDKARFILAAHNRGASSNSQSSGGFKPDIRVINDDGLNSEYPGVNGYDAVGEVNGLSYDEAQALDAVDLFGYQANNDCFWQTKRNDLLTTVVQPVYDRKNESVVTEKFLVKNVWTVKETVMRTAQILGVAAADMKINDIIALAPSHKLGPNGYAVMLTNNGFAMHHPDLRSILEPFSSDPSERNMRILKPFFSSLDFTQVEHVLDTAKQDADFVAFRREAVAGLTGWHELNTKRALDCQKRVQSRRQKFYYKPIQQFPFSFIIAIPQPYGAHRLDAQVEVKGATLAEKLTTYFTTSDFDLWTVHPEYQYCEGAANNTIATLLDMFQRVEREQFDDIQWRAAESSKPPVFLPGKIVCDKELVQSLVYDAVATFGFPETCGPPSPTAESSLLGMFGVRFSFVAMRSGLTRVRHYDSENEQIKREALAFAKKHSRTIDETFYSRTVDYNMLINENATLIQVPFNAHEKIRDFLLNLATTNNDQMSSYELGLEPTSGGLDTATGPPFARNSLKDLSLVEQLELMTNESVHVIASQSILVKEGAQSAVAGVAGTFYNYASFVLRFLNSTNSRFEEGRAVTKPAHCFADSALNDEACDEWKSSIRCGLANDTIDCLLVDNNGYIVVSENLDFIGRHLKNYEPSVMARLVNQEVFHEINVTDYQAVCMRQGEEKASQTTSSSSCALHLSSMVDFKPNKQLIVGVFSLLAKNLMATLTYTWTILTTLSSLLGELTFAQASNHAMNKQQQQQQQQQSLQPMLSLLPNKTYLRPCEKTLSLYETRSAKLGSYAPQPFKTRCGCPSWFVYEQVPKTNLLLIIVDLEDHSCRSACPAATKSNSETSNVKYSNTEEQVCGMLERESQLYRKKLDACFEHHPDEEHIQLCGAGAKSAPISLLLILVISFFNMWSF